MMDIIEVVGGLLVLYLVVSVSSYYIFGSREDRRRVSLYRFLTGKR